MERLYYEPPKNILQPKAYSGEGTGVSEHLTKVSKLIPSEVITGYLAMFGLVSLTPKQSQSAIYWIILLACFILTPLYLNILATEGKPKRNHLIISTLSFIVWAYATTGKTLQDTIFPDTFNQAIASIIIILFSLISAIVPLTK